jgi:hypothetical protein
MMLMGHFVVTFYNIDKLLRHLMLKARRYSAIGKVIKS